MVYSLWFRVSGFERLDKSELLQFGLCRRGGLGACSQNCYGCRFPGSLDPTPRVPSPRNPCSQSPNAYAASSGPLYSKALSERSKNNFRSLFWTTWAQATVASFCLGEAENTGEILEKPCGNAGCCTGAFTTSSCWSKQVIYNASYTAPFKILPIARTRHIACQCTKYRKILQAGPTLRTSVHMYKAREPQRNGE